MDLQMAEKYGLSVLQLCPDLFISQAEIQPPQHVKYSSDSIKRSLLYLKMNILTAALWEVSLQTFSRQLTPET